MRVTCLLILAAGVANAAPPSIYESRELADTTEGDAIVARSADEAYRIATDFARWPELFADVKRATVTHRERNEATVTLAYRDGTVEDVRIHSRPAALTLVLEQHANHIDATAEITFAPTDDRATCRVHARLHATANGWASLLASDADVRAARQERLRARLAGMQRKLAR